MTKTYYIINDSVCKNLGYNKYIVREQNPCNIIQLDLTLAKMADIIFVSGTNGIKYLKNRYPDKLLDIEERTFVVLSSVEDVFQHS